ncbi:MAG: hypothetical protein COT67_02800 [Candidatus Tagabacteria bacterium CG09_land_8_20_14_0_10_41_14]|uniref:Uncharacterized protein n=1 Tax=Candidatus Tagabacteria bacterium CG09_land_8_20_14_0_10_41_14 TaxID=1975021 RepID=A0A2H0WKN9_9BACT|nr:MAG: hypothetical protein COT67_02800 [Candidatus Tagabacteria bacterium CG09_land_8_20_14_0_10_41_14]
MNQKGISSIVIILIIVGVLGLAGGVWYYLVETTPIGPGPCPQDLKTCPDGTQVSRALPNCEFASCPEVKDETADWKTYKNDGYGFEVKYPNKNYNVFETKPNLNYGDKFLLDIDIGRNDGSFRVEIRISENMSRNSSKDNLQGEIMKWYGVSNWPFNFPTADAQIKEFSIDNHPSIKSNYIARGEGAIADPAVQIFTLNSQYIYKIDYIGDIKEGDLIISSFKFLK